VNIVPLRAPGVDSPEPRAAWWEDADMAALEDEWRTSGTAAGVPVPGEWRGFVFKTVVALRAAGRPVHADAIADSAARWLAPVDAERLRVALRAAASS
jgi:hypothetical protein